MLASSVILEIQLPEIVLKKQTNKRWSIVGWDYVVGFIIHSGKPATVPEIGLEKQPIQKLSKWGYVKPLSRRSIFLKYRIRRQIWKWEIVVAWLSSLTVSERPPWNHKVREILQEFSKQSSLATKLATLAGQKAVYNGHLPPFQQTATNQTFFW